MKFTDHSIVRLVPRQTYVVIFKKESSLCHVIIFNFAPIIVHFLTASGLWNEHTGGKEVQIVYTVRAPL